MSADDFSNFAGVLGLLIWLGLTIDRYWIEPGRISERIHKQWTNHMKRCGICPLCKRPVEFVEDEPIDKLKPET